MPALPPAGTLPVASPAGQWHRRRACRPDPQSAVGRRHGRLRGFRLSAVLLLGGLLSVGCRGETAWRQQAPAALAGAELAQWERATAARDALAGKLLQELTAALADGPAAAIAVCSERAPALAASISAERGLRISRSSLRLRNPANRSPEWAVAHIDRDASSPAAFVAPDGRLGALLPIPLQAACQACHGEAAALAEPVRAALAARYPEDRATGYSAGDLRGWFVVEVPRLP